MMKKIWPLTLSVTLGLCAASFYAVPATCCFASDTQVVPQVSGTKAADGYVVRTRKVREQKKIALGELSLPGEVRISDAKATAKTAGLYAYLKGIGASDYVLYGHQNDWHHKVDTKSSNPSDTYDVVGDYPAVAGFDVQAVEGGDFSLTPEEKAAGLTLSEKLANIYTAASKKGVILTMSCHMPNFALVASRGKTDGVYDYTGYSSPDTSGDVVRRILPGGDLNEVYRGYLDMMAGFGQRLQKADVPVICRLFHENDGSWFWWGASYCSPAQYKNLYRYTVEYLRDQKGIHNFLYAYSPGGPLHSTEDYLTRYPGDAYVDVVVFDMYHRNPLPKDSFMDSLGKSLGVLQSFARSHDKVMAGTEVGILTDGAAMARTGNARKDWFREVLQVFSPYDTAYFMTWSNNNDHDFDQPYMIDNRRGHEMVNEFVDFYNEPQSVFASQVDYSGVKAQAEAAQAVCGYFTAPLRAVNAYERYTEPVRITARILGGVQKAEVLYRRQDGSLAGREEASAGDHGQWTAELSREDLAELGQTVGSAELLADGRVLDRMKVIFNEPEPAQNPMVIDDFSGYCGDNGLLKAAYAVNCGAGCSVEPLLKTENDGSFGLDFQYVLVPNGYAGIVRNLKKADWSAADALQFVFRPDGRGQRCIIQLNSHGEDFEVDLSALTKGTEEQVVTLPFARFQGKQHGVFDKTKVSHFAIYCNAAGNEAVSSDLHFANIHVIHAD